MDSHDDNRLPPPPKGYELSGKIMMSAVIVLFVVVVVMVFLHVYARWYILRVRSRNHPHLRRSRRRSHPFFFVDSTNPASIVSLPSRGLDPALLKSLPIFVFSSAANAAVNSDKTADGTDYKNVPECAVCLSEFEDGEKGRLLPKCNHSFHVDCIDMWFHSHSTCPLCRIPVESEIPPPLRTVDENLSVELVVELSESSPNESTHHDPPTSSNLCTDCHPGPSSSSSFRARRKCLDLVEVSVEVPARTASFSFSNSDELGSPAGQGFKSPTSRLLSLKRILSREKRPIPSPSSATAGIGTSCAELADVEVGRVETRMSRSQAATPR